MSVVDSQKLHGRMQFPDAQMFGRLGRLCMRAVTSMLSPSLERSWRVKPLMPAKVSIFLENAEPRSLTLSSDSVWNIFTDACYEPQRDSWKCGFGGVLVDPFGRRFSFFSVEPVELSDLRKQKTIIFEAELFGSGFDIFGMEKGDYFLFTCLFCR